MQGKTFGPEQATSLNTYKFMKVGDKKYRESGSSVSIDNLKSKQRLVSCYELCTFFETTIISTLNFDILFILLEG